MGSYKYYIFNKAEFKYFSTKGCWGAKKGKKTIFNILKCEGQPPEKWKEIIDFYNTQEYKDLFKKSENAWHKVNSLLSNKF
jgi:hypothetical protein